jgi:hypothetical protein
MTTPTTKHEWRKHEKPIYGAKQVPTRITLPRFKFISIHGEGNPNGEDFGQRIAALYPIAYGIKMTAKKPGMAPKGHFDYTVYPLEGVWGLREEAIEHYSGTLNKEDLVYDIMLRQPDFVTEDYFREIVEIANKKKPNPLYDELCFNEIEEGPCVQMLHVGPFDTEAASFEIMEAYAREQGLTRTSKMHREIYLSDFRKTAAEKLKTILRFRVE